MNKEIAILGCGWLGLPLAISLMEKGFGVDGSTTTQSKVELLKSKGIRPHLISISEEGIDGNMGAFLGSASVLIINIPPRLRGAKTENYVRKMELLFAEAQRYGIEKVLFISSTSVYGNLQGEVTEKSDPKPATESGKQLFEVENMLRQLTTIKTTVVRLGGLIGEDRHPVTRLAGKTGLTNGNECGNLIHQNDCIRIIEQVIVKKWWNLTLNGVYPYHPKKETYYTAEAHKKGLQAPEYNRITALNCKKIKPYTLLNVKGFLFNTSICS